MCLHCVPGAVTKMEACDDNALVENPPGQGHIITNNCTACRRRASPVAKQRRSRRGQPYERPINSVTALVVNTSSNAADLLRKTLTKTKTGDHEVKKEVSEVVFNEINRLLKCEKPFPRNPLQLYEETLQNLEDNVDGAMRDEEVLNLRFLQGYYNLHPETLARAQSIVDHFILKVRVKPKYMACVATAAYYMAVVMHEDAKDWPSKEELVMLTRCGGTTEDLTRMVDIIQSKLPKDLLNSSTAIDFARVVMKQSSSCNAYSSERMLSVFSRILVGHTSLYVYQFPVAAVALASLWLEAAEHPVEALQWLEGSDMWAVSQCCGVTVASVRLCADYLKTMYTLFYQRALPCSRDRLIWSLSRRTRSKLSSVRSNHLDEKLYPIMESNETEVDIDE